VAPRPAEERIGLKKITGGLPAIRAWDDGGSSKRENTMSHVEIFNAVVKLFPEERAAFLDTACGANRELRNEVESLLLAHDAPVSFLREPPDRTPAYEPATERVGGVIGPYKLVEQIGEGGFGVVFLAEQTGPVRRKVALKILKAGMDTRQVVARFEAERQALAIMDHPNIARVFDGGATPSGRPYFVMELVNGVPITDFCDHNHLNPRQRLELFVPVCQAVQHAHQKGIIHRDLKPSNVLVSRHDSTPFVKVIDFGVAKALGQELTDKTIHTGIAQMVGTPLYMSPEQAGMSDLDVDTRSDIYSLGVMLYELLTGSTPFSKERFQRAAYDEIRRIIREEEPPTPSTRLAQSNDSLPSISAQRQTEPARLTKLVRGELDWIVMKALEKDRNRRYETANGFAIDVQRYLADEPVSACPPSTTYRFRKFVRRHKRGVVVGAALLVMLLVATLSLAVSTVRVWREQKRTQEANLRLKDNLELALQALDEIHLKVAEDRLPRDPVRKQEYLDLLKRTLSFYEQFALQNNTDPLVRKAQAKAHQRAGTIRVLLDQLPEAKADLGRAINMNEVLRAELPADRDVRFNLATSHVNLAMLQFRGGRHAEALPNLDKAQALLDELVAEEPREPGYRHNLAQAWNNRGTLLLLERRLREAQQAYERAAERWDELVRERPGEMTFLAGQGGTLINLGEVLRNMGQLPEAEKVFRRALTHYERMVEQDPTGAEWRKQQGVLHSNLGVLLNRMGRNSDAVKANGDAIAVQQRLVADFGTIPEYQGGLALSLLNRSVALGELGRVAETEKDNRESLKHLDLLVKSFPDVPGYRRDQALNYLSLSQVQVLAQKHSEAEQFVRQAIAIQEELAAKHPTVPEYQFDLAKSWQVLGEQLAGRNCPKEAEAALQKTIALTEALAKGWPNVAEFRAVLARYLALRGRVLRAARRPDEAWEPEQRAIDIFEQLVTEFPDDMRNRVDLAENVHEHARLLRLAKRYEQAEKAGVRAQELWERLIADYPTVAQFRIYLGGHLNNRGQLCRERGDLKGACDYYERAIVHQEEARKLDPSSAMARTFLGNHYGNLADVLLSRGLHAEAAKAADNLPRIVPDEFQGRRAALLLLQCVRCAEKDATTPAADRTAVVRGYAEKIRGLLEQAERRAADTPAASMSLGFLYDTACAYAFLVGEERGDAKKKDHYSARAIQLLRQVTLPGKQKELVNAVKTDTDLDPLRAREDFKKLVAELESKGP
jgi:eukaryotic-like serine/threonine-protein kinase